MTIETNLQTLLVELYENNLRNLQRHILRICCALNFGLTASENIVTHFYTARGKNSMDAVKNISEYVFHIFSFNVFYGTFFPFNVFFWVFLFYIFFFRFLLFFIGQLIAEYDTLEVTLSLTGIYKTFWRLTYDLSSTSGRFSGRRRSSTTWAASLSS